MKICHVFDPSPDPLRHLSQLPIPTDANIQNDSLGTSLLVSGAHPRFSSAWGRRHNSADGLGSLGPDGISYVDIGGASMRRDWYVAVNAMWTPLYSWLLGVTLHLFDRHHSGNSVALVELPDLHRRPVLLRFLPAGASLEIPPKISHVRYPIGFTHFCYPIFIWTSLFMDRVSHITPDMLFTALFFSHAELLRIQSDSHPWHSSSASESC